MSLLDTPIGPLAFDQQGVHDLLAAAPDLFDVATPRQDAVEHSLEAQFPLIAHTMHGDMHSVLPIIVGPLSARQERQLGALLQPFLDAPDTLIVISTDLCHYGERCALQLCIAMSF